jgi:hypothetical protein
MVLKHPNSIQKEKVSTKTKVIFLLTQHSGERMSAVKTLAGRRTFQTSTGHYPCVNSTPESSGLRIAADHFLFYWNAKEITTDSYLHPFI